MDYYSKNWVDCFEVQNELDYQGSWLVSAGAAINNPDHVYLQELSLHDGGDPTDGTEQVTNEDLH
jgi:hypothetical protein